MNWFSDVLLSRNFWFGSTTKKQTAPNLSVTVVIPAWNEEACLADTIRSVQAQTHRVSIIVVDDCSTDNTGAIARSMGVTCLVPDNNTGTKSQALNVALPHVDTDLFICVDADTRLETDAVHELLKSFNDPKVAVASGYVLATNGNTFWEKARTGDYLWGQTVMKAAQNNLNTVMVASGCFIAVRTDLLKQIGGFKERSMAEDMDMTWELIEMGYRVGFNQHAVCHVIDPPNWKIFNKQVSRWYHGLFQCIKVRKFRLFHKNPRLGIIAYGNWALNLFGPLLPFVLLFWSQSTIGVIDTLAVVATYAVVLWTPVYYRAFRLGVPLRRVTASVLPLIIGGYVTYGIFVTAMIKELVMNKSLTVWIKGH